MTYSIRALFHKAKEEGRICTRCGWMITVKDWKKHFTECAACRYALKGVNIKYGHGKARDESVDMTGEML